MVNLLFKTIFTAAPCTMSGNVIPRIDNDQVVNNLSLFIIQTLQNVQSKNWSFHNDLNQIYTFLNRNEDVAKSSICNKKATGAGNIKCELLTKEVVQLLIECIDIHSNEDNADTLPSNAKPSLNLQLNRISVGIQLIRLWIYTTYQTYFNYLTPHLASNFNTESGLLLPSVTSNSILTSTPDALSVEQTLTRYELLLSQLMKLLERIVDALANQTREAVDTSSLFFVAATAGDTVCYGILCGLSLSRQDASARLDTANRFFRTNLAKCISTCCTAVELAIQTANVTRVGSLVESIISILTSPLLPWVTAQPMVETIVKLFLNLYLNTEKTEITSRKAYRLTLCYVCSMGKPLNNYNSLKEDCNKKTAINFWEILVSKIIKDLKEAIDLLESKKATKNRRTLSRLVDLVELLTDLLDHFSGFLITVPSDFEKCSKGFVCGYLPLDDCLDICRRIHQFLVNQFISYLQVTNNTLFNKAPDHLKVKNDDNQLPYEIQCAASDVSFRSCEGLITPTNLLFSTLLKKTPVTNLMMRCSVIRQVLDLYGLSGNLMTFEKIATQLQFSDTTASIITTLEQCLPSLLKALSVPLLGSQTMLLQLLTGNPTTWKTLTIDATTESLVGATYGAEAVHIILKTLTGRFVFPEDTERQSLLENSQKNAVLNSKSSSTCTEADNLQLGVWKRQLCNTLESLHSALKLCHSSSTYRIRVELTELIIRLIWLASHPKESPGYDATLCLNYCDEKIVKALIQFLETSIKCNRFPSNYFQAAVAALEGIEEHPVIKLAELRVTLSFLLSHLKTKTATIRHKNTANNLISDYQPTCSDILPPIALKDIIRKENCVSQNSSCQTAISAFTEHEKGTEMPLVLTKAQQTPINLNLAVISDLELTGTTQSDAHSYYVKATQKNQVNQPYLVKQQAAKEKLISVTLKEDTKELPLLNQAKDLEIQDKSESEEVLYSPRSYLHDNNRSFQHTREKTLPAVNENDHQEAMLLGDRITNDYTQTDNEHNLTQNASPVTIFQNGHNTKCVFNDVCTESNTQTSTIISVDTAENFSEQNDHGEKMCNNMQQSEDAHSQSPPLHNVEMLEGEALRRHALSSEEMILRCLSPNYCDKKHVTSGIIDTIPQKTIITTANRDRASLLDTTRETTSDTEAIDDDTFLDKIGL